ncbi:MAG: acetyltransferase [Alphaproteobacteria bacterium]|nr:acetyltransferase [Alphaproteobacteria bacterium]
MSMGLIVIGAGGHATSVTNVALSCGYSVFAYADDKQAGGMLNGIPVFSEDTLIASYPNSFFAIAVGDNAKREDIALRLLQKINKAQFPKLVHDSAIVGAGCHIGCGTVVMPGAVLGPTSEIGEFCIVNSGASLDHDTALADYASLAPGVVLGGNVSVGNRAAISIGATIKHNVSVGKDTVIGAASYVHSDIGECCVAFGSPCKEVKSRKRGETYLG